MGGQSAIRGFVLQTLVTLFEALSTDHPWVAVEIEPKIESEKVDVLWHYNDGTKRAVQVKSSENQISKTQAKAWAEELQNSFEASSYELILLGQCSQALTKINLFGSVKVPPPKNIDIEGFSCQLAYKLDIYMEQIGTPRVSPRVLEMFVHALADRFLGYSTRGEKVERAAFIKLINGWVGALYAGLPKEQPGVQPVRDHTFYSRLKKAVQYDLEQWKKRVGFDSNRLIELTIGFERKKPEDEVRWVTVEEVAALMISGYEFILKGPPGAGKTITLLQVVEAITSVSEEVLPFLVSAPSWAASQLDLPAWLEKTLAFRAEGVTATELARLIKEGRAVVLLNGWNEIPESFSDNAALMLHDFAGSTGVFVTTRERSRLPSFHNPLLLTIERLDIEQRRLLVRKWNSQNFETFLRHIEFNEALDQITRTPLFLSAFLSTSFPGGKMATNRYDLLDRMVSDAEQRLEHKDALARPPLSGRHREYLIGLAAKMVEGGGALLLEQEALSTIMLTSKQIVESDRMANLPEPITLLDTLCDHHLLIKSIPSPPSIQFMHQQFQEWFTALGLYQRLSTLVENDGRDQGINLFQERFINQPIWEEALLLTAECIGHKADSLEDPLAVVCGSNLVKWALFVDPIFSGQLAQRCGHKVWQEVKELFGKQLRQWYNWSEEGHKECPLAAILASGKSDFADIIWPLLEDSDQQTRLRTYRTWEPFLLSSLGGDWQPRIAKWNEECRVEFVHEVGWRPSAEMIALVSDIADKDESPKVRAAALEVLGWHGALETVIGILERAPNEVLQASNKVLDLLPVPDLRRLEMRLKSIVSGPIEGAARSAILHVLMKMDDEEVVKLIKREIEASATLDKLEGFLNYIHQRDSSWTGDWLLKQILSNTLPPSEWAKYLEGVPENLLETLLDKALDENINIDLKRRMLYFLPNVKPLYKKTARKIVAAYLQLCKKACKSKYDERQSDQIQSLKAVVKKLPFSNLVEEVFNTYSDLEDDGYVLDLLRLFPHPSFASQTVKITLPEILRKRLRELLHVWIGKFGDSYGNGDLQITLATILSLVGDKNDLAILAKLIDWEIARIHREDEEFRHWLSSGRGGAQPSRMRWDNWYIPALMRLDSEEVGEVLLNLLEEPTFEEEAALGIVRLVGKTEPHEIRGLSLDRPDYSLIYECRKNLEGTNRKWDARNSQKYIAGLVKRIQDLLAEYQVAEKKEGISRRLTALGYALARIGSIEEIQLLLEVSKVGKGSWRLVNTLHTLILRGFVLPSSELKKVLQPIIDEALTIKSPSGDNWYLVKQAIIILLFSDNPDSGIDVLNALEPSIKRSHQIRDLLKLIGISKAQKASKFLIELTQDTSFNLYASELIEALGKLATPASKKRLIELIQFKKRGDIRKNRDSLTDTLAELACKDAQFKQDIYVLCSEAIESETRSLLGEVLEKIGTEKAALVACSLLRDGDAYIPFCVDKLFEEIFTERVASAQYPGSYYLKPKECNRLRQELFRMATEDDTRKKSALRLLIKIENMRRETGRPNGEPRHPHFQSGRLWPFLEQPA